MSTRNIIVLVVAIIIILIIGGITFYSSRPPEPPRTVIASKQTVAQNVEFTGQLAAKQKADLSFEVTGRLTEILVTEGETVTKGQPLARINASIAQLELASASAARLSAIEQAKLALDQARTTAEKSKKLNQKTIELNKQAVRNTHNELTEARNVHNKTDDLTGDSVASQTAVASIQTKQSLYNTARETLKQTLATADQAAATNEAAIDNAEAAYLATIQASSNSGAPSVLSANRNLAAARVNQTVLTAPIDGIVTRQHKELGETVITGNTIFTIQTTNQIEITANVTETDAAKIRNGLDATITFDALPPQEQWNAQVSYTSPAANIIEGVPTYEFKLDLNLPQHDPRLKPGLTANIIVHAAEKSDVIAIPRRAVTTRGDEQFVSIYSGPEEIKEVKVATGLIGTDGLIEIVRGLPENSEVVLDITTLEQE